MPLVAWAPHKMLYYMIKARSMWHTDVGKTMCSWRNNNCVFFYFFLVFLTELLSLLHHCSGMGVPPLHFSCGFLPVPGIVCTG